MTPNLIIYIEKLNKWKKYLNYIFKVNTSEFIHYLGPYQLGEHSLQLLVFIFSQYVMLHFLSANEQILHFKKV
jgi:hypothetical protein